MNRIIIILGIISLACISCKSKSQIQASNTAKKSEAELVINTLSLQDSLINYGKNYLRVPYRYGGTTSKGFDCSGFTSHVYKNFGYNLNRSSRDQATQFPAVQKRDLQTGDLVFFEGRKKNKVVGHVGIVTNTKPNGDFDFIHASVQSGVTVSSSTEAYYASRYLKAGRVINDGNTPSFVRNAPSSAVNESVTPYVKSQPAPQSNIVDAIYHTVKKGDNLALISRKYDVPISTIQHLNNLPSKRIKRGQKLLITEAVNVPEMPIVAVQKVDFDRIVELDERNNIALEPRKEVANNFPNTVNQQQRNAEIRPATSQKLEPQETAQVLIAETAQPVIQRNAQKHKVVAGESLFSIAKKYNLTVDELKSMNNLSSNSINAGQMLAVANAPETAPQIAIENEQTASSTVHTVKAGETLYSIARQYGCSVNDLRKWNPNLSDAIKIGEKIKINP